MESIVETLAQLEHERWASWQAYLHSKCIENADGSLTISADLVKHWQRQIKAAYSELSEREKESDRKEVRKTLLVLSTWFARQSEPRRGSGTSGRG